MTNVFKEQVKSLEAPTPNFKIARAIIHYDKTDCELITNSNKSNKSKDYNTIKKMILSIND